MSTQQIMQDATQGAADLAVSLASTERRIVALALNYSRKNYGEESPGALEAATVLVGLAAKQIQLLGGVAPEQLRKVATHLTGLANELERG